VWPAALVLGAIGLASFGLAFLLTHALIGRNRSLLAFYASPTRAWEFIAGALLALGVPALVRMTSKRSGSWSTLFAVLAVPMLVASAVGFRGRVMAGPVGLLPVSATCLALAAGAVSAGGLSRLLAWRPLVWIGDRSYSIYLWHWPFIVYAVSLWGRRWPVMTAAALVSIVPAALSFRFVEEPIRRASFRPWQVVRLASACAAVPILASAGLLVATRASWGMDFIQDLTDRNGAFQSDIAGCQRIGDATYKCDHVSTGARGSVFLVGDSHAISLSPAVTAAGLALHLDVSVRAKGGCSFSDLPGDQASDCQSWARSIVREIAVARPDVVVIHQCARVGAGCPASGQSWLPTWRDGLNRIVRAIRPSTGAVLVVGDVPGFEKDIASCVTVLRPLRTGSSCGQRDLLDWDRDNAPVVAAERAATEDLAGVTHVDPTPAVCGRSVCEQVRDGVAMYFDSHHLTLRGAAQLTPLLQAELAQAAGGLPTR
jgi:hypothetical protein